jgi:aquaporin Z
MKKYVTEFIGTYFLVLVIGLMVVPPKSDISPFAPLAIGTALMVMVYMGGHVSGAHYNPAVTLAVFLRGRLSVADILPYMVAQLVGAFAAAATVTYLLGETFAPAPVKAPPQAVVNEALFTFALALVVLNVATAKGTANNSFYGLAIGMTVMMAAYAGGGISGGAYNPAVGAGPILLKAITGGGTLANLWIYLAGPFAGGAAAAAVFKMQNPTDV